MDDYERPDRVVGVAFAADERHAGERTWLAEGRVADGALELTDCRPLADLLDVDPARETAVPALAEHLGSLDPDVAVGLDFPFGLPASVVTAPTWRRFLWRLPDWAQDPSDLQRESEARASLDGDADELLRATEEPLGALSPYGRRLRERTYYGIRDVLRPLVLSGAARALPMQPLDDRTRLLEVYPAGTLADVDGEPGGPGGDGDDRRAADLAVVEGEQVAVPEPVRDRVLDAQGRDPLDSLVAAFAAYRNTLDPANLQTDDDRRALEGHVYV